MLSIIRPGDDMVAAINQEILTVMAVLMVAIVGIWLLSMIIDKRNQVYANFGKVMLLEGLVFSIFMFVLVRPIVASVIFVFFAIFSLIVTLVSVKVDELLDESYEEEERYRRAKAINKYIHERREAP